MIIRALRTPGLVSRQSIASYRHHLSRICSTSGQWGLEMPPKTRRSAKAEPAEVPSDADQPTVCQILPSLTLSSQTDFAERLGADPGPDRASILGSLRNPALCRTPARGSSLYSPSLTFKRSKACMLQVEQPKQPQVLLRGNRQRGRPDTGSEGDLGRSPSSPRKRARRRPGEVGPVSVGATGQSPHIWLVHARHPSRADSGSGAALQAVELTCRSQEAQHELHAERQGKGHISGSMLPRRDSDLGGIPQDHGDVRLVAVGSAMRLRLAGAAQLVVMTVQDGCIRMMSLQPWWQPGECSRRGVRL